MVSRSVFEKVGRAAGKVFTFVNFAGFRRLEAVAVEVAVVVGNIFAGLAYGESVGLELVTGLVTLA